MNDYQQILERAHKWRSDKCLRYNLSMARRHDAEAYHILTQLLAALDAAQPVAWMSHSALTGQPVFDINPPDESSLAGEIPLFAAPQAPPVAADSLRAMSDWLESGEYRVSFNGDESYPLMIGGTMYAPGKPPRVIFECEQAPSAADYVGDAGPATDDDFVDLPAAVPAANVTPLRQPRLDLARLVDAISAAVYANGDGLSVTEAIGALELAKLELLKEQEQ